MRASGTGGEPPARVRNETTEAKGYRRAKEVLGPTAGGLYTKLRQYCSYDELHALDLIEQAAAKENPKEWIGAVLRGDVQGGTPMHILCPPEIYRGVL